MFSKTATGWLATWLMAVLLWSPAIFGTSAPLRATTAPNPVEGRTLAADLDDSPFACLSTEDFRPAPAPASTADTIEAVEPADDEDFSKQRVTPPLRLLGGNSSSSRLRAEVIVLPGTGLTSDSAFNGRRSLRRIVLQI